MRSASCIATADFPDAVGPIIAMTRGVPAMSATAVKIAGDSRTALPAEQRVNP
jgi:hypothetical protein